ncbi:MAG TPA: hypothetical protein VMZ22_01965 [Acidimicrobiales bacterium]|nr:hypothetical protein [Acidimicrobiales bacterium]
MRKGIAIVLWVAIVAIVAGDIVAIQTIDADDPPAAWDPRVRPLVSFVESKRHLRFEHPVPVEFLGKEEFEKTQKTDESDLSKDEQRDIRVFEGQARALGLISSDTRLLDDLNAITTGGTLAFYDPSDKKIVIRGTALTVGLRVTIAHELTHALQDQAFDLEREFDTDGADSFFHALAEGDATRIENEYVDSLSDSQQDEYFEESDSSGEAAKDALRDVAPALLQFFGAPYALGEQVTTLIVAEKGVKALDKLFRTPPDSDEGLVDAFAALDDERALKVRAPKLRAGEKRNDSGDFGVVPWYVVLASFIDERSALNAVDGWGGDSYVGYKKADRSCIRIAFRGDTPADANEMAAALNQWKAAFTENTVQVTMTKQGVELDACEPTVVPTPRAGAAEALTLPVTRLALLGQVLSEGAERKLAECLSRNFVAQVRLDALDGATEAEQQYLFDLVTQLGRACANGRLGA